MLNKKKVAIVAIIFIAIITGIIAIVLNVNKGTKIENLYNNLLEQQSYLFSMKSDSAQTTIAKKDKNTSIDNDGEYRTTTIIKDGTTYLLDHSSKEYYIYEGDIEEGNIITDTLQELVGKDCNNGSEKVNGKTYKYEEYNGFAGFIMTETNKELDETKARTKFYFKGDELCFIKTILEDTEELLEVQVSSDVPDEIFEIPSDYAEAKQ